MGTRTVGEIDWDIGYPHPVVWTGDKVVMIGASGSRVGRPGAAFDVARERWRKVPAVPFRERLAGGDGVWTGKRLVVAGIRCNNRADENDEASRCYPGSFAAAAWDPRRNAWRKIPGPTGLGLEPGNDGTWGRVVGAWGDDVVAAIRDQIWVLDGDSLAWSRLPDTSRRDSFTLCVADDHLVDVDLSSMDDVVRSVAVLERGAMGWQAAEVLTIGEPLSALDFVCADDAVLVRTTTLSGAWRLDPSTLEWSTQPTPPQELTEGATFHSGFWTGAGFVFWDNYGDHTTVAFDPRLGTWDAVQPPPSMIDRILRVVAWADGVGYFPTIKAPSGNGPLTLVAYRPVPG